METYYIKHQKEKSRNSTLYTRMDADRRLLTSKFKLLAKDGIHEIPNTRPITLNDPNVFFANVVSRLSAAVEQRVVESDDEGFDTASVEEFLDAAFGAAGLRRATRGEPQINPYFDEQSCIRGRLGARCLFQMVKGAEGKDVLDADITPWDMRYVTYSQGVNGLAWGAYESWKTRGVVESEQWFNDTHRVKTISVKDKDNEVLDVWDTEHNEIWLNGSQVFEQAHDWGYTPVAVEIVPLGSMTADKDNQAQHGESLFFLIRDLVDELNELGTIAKTINFRSIEGALQEATKEGRTATPGKYDAVTKAGSVSAIDIGGGYSNMPIQDVMRAFGQLLSVVESRIQRGSLSSIDLGIMPGQPPSAIALIQISEGRDQVFLPRLGARGLLNQQLAFMIIDQVLKIGGSVELGAKGHKKAFQVSELDGDYDIVFKYFIKDTKVDAARYSIAGVAERYFDRRTVLSEVIQAEDPDGILLKKYRDEAEDISPIVKRTKIIKALYESGDPDDEFYADQLALEAGMDVQRILAGEVPEVPQKKAPASLPMPIFGATGEKSSAKKAAELQGTPTGEAGGE